MRQQAVADLMEGWAHAAARWPRATLAGLAALVLAAAAATAAFLEVTSDTDAMLAADLPYENRVRSFEAAFPDLRHLLAVGIDAQAPEEAEATAEALAAALGRAPAVAGSYAPEIDPFFRAHWPLYRDLPQLEVDLARLSGAADLIARLRSEPTVEGFVAALAGAARLAGTQPGGMAALDPVLAEAAAVWQAARAGRARPFSWQRAFAGGDSGGSALWLSVAPRLDLRLLSPAEPALEAIAQAQADLPPDLAQGVRLSVTGEAAMRAEEMESVVSGLGLSFAVSMALVAAILWLGQGGGRRGAGRALLTLAVMLAALVLTTGFAALALAPLNLISVAFVVLMVGLGVDFPIHFLAHLRRAGTGGAAAVARGHGGALALAALTTAAGFLAFGATDFIGLAQLGAIGGAGVLIAFTVTLTALPAAAALWPGLGGAAAPAPEASHSASRRRVLWRGAAGAALALAAAAVAPQARFDADPLNLRPADAPAARAFARLAEAPGTTPYRLNLLAPDAAEAARLAAALEALPEVAGTIWLGALVPQGQEAKLELIDIAWPSLEHALAANPSEAGDTASDPRAALLAMLQAPGAGSGAAALAGDLAQGDPAGLEAALFRHFPALLDRLAALRDVQAVTGADLPEALRTRYQAADGRLRVEILPRGDLRDAAAMRTFVAAVHGVAPEAAGTPDEISGAAATVGDALLTAVALALAATLALVGLATRRLAVMLAVAAPILAAAALTAAAGVLLSMPFNYANMIVLPLLFGFGADTGIYLARASEGGTPSDIGAVARRAAVVSAATTAAAFGALALSAHPGTASMGVMLVISLAAVVAMAFTLTPAILALTGKHAEHRR